MSSNFRLFSRFVVGLALVLSISGFYGTGAPTTQSSKSSALSVYSTSPVIGFGNASALAADQQITPTSLIVAMAMTATGKGYWVVSAKGEVFAYGDAVVWGSAANVPLYAPIVGMAATPDGKGYWLVAADGGIFTFGDATFYGSMGGQNLNAQIMGMAALPNGNGYWEVANDGGIFSFGNAVFMGSLGSQATSAPIAQMTTTLSGDGYYLLSPDSFTYNFQPTQGERLTSKSGQIIAAAESQIGPASSPGSFCNPYGPCEEWCSLFAAWAWNQAGISTPEYGFTGTLFDWVSLHAKTLSSNDMPAEGDFVFYGTGPQSSSTSVHMGVIVETWGDGSLETIEGDSGPGDAGYLGVTVNGPFLASSSLEYNGNPIYGYGEPLS